MCHFQRVKGQVLHAKSSAWNLKYASHYCCASLSIILYQQPLLGRFPGGLNRKTLFQHLLLGERGLLWKQHLAYSHEFYKERNK